MDILRKELNAFYESQNLSDEVLDVALLNDCRKNIETVAGVEGDCLVITDASRDYCYIWGGTFSKLIGLSESDHYFKESNSSDEDEIYNRIHPEDLVDKRMLEYEFFKYIDTCPDALKLGYMATSHIRIKDDKGRYVYADNSTRILRLSPKGKVWLILCRYQISPLQTAYEGIAPRIICNTTGEVLVIPLSERRTHILTNREKQILTLIKDGKLSKQIAAILGISIHTVNRHRQNILDKLSVGNSVEAVTAATLMKLL